MKQYYCTLFDSFYLSRGLAMHRSLMNSSKEFHLYIFPFDALSLQILEALKLDHVTIVSLAEFENERLLAVKSSRTKGEYCWTCTPSVIDYCLKHFSLPHCTYVDADLYFFSEPSVLVEEMGNQSVLITEHRYSSRYDQSATSGIYCVQFITFKNDENGTKVLDTWRDQCIEWCFDRFEDGKFGDQKYLDHWTKEFDGVHVLSHLGGGLAPWNAQRYSLTIQNNLYSVSSIDQPAPDPLVFYHFHGLKFLTNGRVDLGAYDLGADYINDLYRKYLGDIDDIHRQLTNQFKFTVRTQGYLTKRAYLTPLHKVARRVMGVYNVHNLASFIGHGATH